ncbi:hypothetical protein HYX06_05860 [Candidatus Woesearchaeota archaeon]|nr:hypothetical protein [Candidatus Woesearchaeota archaeon]
MKTSQLYGQIFIYALTLILISVILVYGYTSIKNFKQKTEDITTLKFQKDLKNAIESITNDYGSVSRKEFQLSGDIRQVCFVETIQPFDKSNPIGNLQLNSLVINSVKDSDKNVFLLENTLRSSFSAGKISVDRDILCIKPSNNRITLRLEGKGDHAVLSEWT